MRLISVAAALLLLAACQTGQGQISCRPVTVDTGIDPNSHTELICVPREAVAAEGYDAYRRAAAMLPRTVVR